MRLGYGLLTAQRHPADARPWADLYAEAIEYGVLADTAGFDSLWTSEHHFVDDGYLPAQLPVLAAIAARTTRIRLGTGVLLAPMFDPLHLAEDAAVVDLISRGRLILGLGIGWRDEEFDGFGVPASQRASRIEGTISVLRQAWGEGLVTGDGRRFAYPEPGLNVTPKPVRGAATPIWIGAGAEPAVRRAGRIADGYLGSGASPEAIAQRAAWIREEAEAAGRDPAGIEIAVHRMAFAWRGAGCLGAGRRRGPVHGLEVRGHGARARVAAARLAGTRRLAVARRGPRPDDRRDARAGRGGRARLRGRGRPDRVVRVPDPLPGAGAGASSGRPSTRSSRTSCRCSRTSSRARRRLLVATSTSRV